MEQVDPESIEGSPERIAARGRDQLFGLGFPVEPGTHSLGDPDVVESLIREFGSGVIDARVQYQRGQLSGAACTAQITSLSQRNADIFLGRDPAFTAPAWNTDGSLARTVEQRWYIDPSPDSVQQLFMKFARLMLAAIEGVESGRVTEDVAKFDIEANTESMLDTLMGYPEH